MNQTNFAPNAPSASSSATAWHRPLMLSFLFCLVFALMPELAQAGGSGDAQARITEVAVGWQGIVVGIGVAVLVIAWSVIGYAVAFNGKTMKDMQNPAIGTTVAGIAPILVGWMFG